MRARMLGPAAVTAVVLLAGIVFFYLRAVERTRDAIAEAERAEAEREWPGRLPNHPRFAVNAPRSADRALDDGVRFLVTRQSPDGAWQSDVYASFKDGTALTPLVVCALQDSLQASDTELALPLQVVAARRGSEYLAALVKPDGSIVGGEAGLEYPVYTASLAVKALSHPENKDLLKARDAWVKYLLDRQLTEALGWKPDDKEYGGWGYCPLVPKKPEPGQLAPPRVESNLSATVFALDALRAAGVTDQAVLAKALGFVQRCQNADGGFFFIYDDPVRNKAGSPDPPEVRPTRFHSYGSTSADGLRALQLCDAQGAGRAKADEWLRLNFKADTHPGTYVRAHEPNREAVYYYYAASAAKALRTLQAEGTAPASWAKALATELTRRQKEDGSWANPVELVRENDPIVATANAVIALANCRAALAAR